MPPYRLCLSDMVFDVRMKLLKIPEENTRCNTINRHIDESLGPCASSQLK